MNFDESMSYLASSMKFGSRLGLERMDKLMEFLGQPAMDIPCFHIAGTNGKGSVTTMIADILAASGKRVGVYTSPYLNRFTERIRIIEAAGGLYRLSTDETEGEISREHLAECITEVKLAADKILESGGDHPTEFELVTAAAFLHYRNMKCDYIVLETGLGGRLDSTNVVKLPVRSVITAIGYDHMDRLGNSIEEIAAEKAGIIKKNGIVILLNPMDYTDAETAGKILKVIKDKAIEMRALLVITGLSDISNIRYTLEGQSFVLEFRRRTKLKITTPLLGTFQPLNCACAAIACMNHAYPKHIITGIKFAKWPGRMELIRKSDPTVILDGAHNSQGAAALRESIEKFFPDKKIVFICGVMSDKNYTEIFNLMFSSEKYRVGSVFCTKPDNARALPSSDLAACIREILDKSPTGGYNGLEVFNNDDVTHATLDAIAAARREHAILVAFGSLYMAGVIRETVMQFNPGLAEVKSGLA